MWSIYALSDWQWWASFLWFWVAIGVSWFIPGLVVLSYLKISKSLQFFIAPVLGLCLWALQGYAFGWLGIRAATYVYIVVFLVWAWRRRAHIIPFAWKIQLPPIVWLLLFAGVILQLVPVWGSGWMSDIGVRYYFVNIFDGIFHLSLARSLVDNIPPLQPGAVGLTVTNYHYLSNLVLAELTRIWHLPLNHLYFQYLPVFGSLWLGLTVVLLLKQWSKNTWTLVFGLLLLYGVGELSWLINIVLGSNSNVPFEVFVDHGILQFLNPPQAFAKLVFIAVLILLHQFWVKRTWQLAVVIGLMVSTIVGFKVYFGLGMALGLSAACALLVGVWLAKHHNYRRWPSLQKIWQECLPFVVLALTAGALAALIYIPANASAGGLFFDFLTWPKLMLGFTKLNWNEWWLRLQVYQAAGNTKALVVWYGMAVAIFLFVIYHIRLIGLGVVLPRLRQGLLQTEVVFLLVPSVIFSFIGMNFLQVSGGSNTFNFMVVALTMLNLSTAIVLGRLAQNRILAVICLVVVCLTLVQTAYVQYFFTSNYFSGTNSQLISRGHLDALAFIKTQSNPTVVQTLPQHYFDETTPYFYFFTGKSSYFGGRGILNSHNQPVANQQIFLDEFALSDATTSAQLALEAGITDVFLMHSAGAEEQFYLNHFLSSTNSAVPHWQAVFNNADVVILRPKPKQEVEKE